MGHCCGSSDCLWHIVLSVEKETAKEEPPKTDNNAKWQEAEHTPYGKYPETVTYTLGKISGGNHSNLPAGDTYEDNGYTRYLKKMLNIQNKDVFELEDGNQYEEVVEIAIKDNNLPDIMVVKGQETVQKLAEAGMIEDLTEVYEECTTWRIKDMYASYTDALLNSGKYEGSFMDFRIRLSTTVQRFCGCEKTGWTSWGWKNLPTWTKQ